jgi:antitoxin CptB
MRELDVLLTAWLECSYSTAGEEQRQAFEALLDREDDEIWDWMMGRAVPPESLTAVVDSIGRHHADQRARL